MSLHVNLTPELEEFVRDRVQGGDYKSASEVVRDALRLLAERERERQARLSRSPGSRRGLEGIERRVGAHVGAHVGAEESPTGETSHGELNAQLREAFELIGLAYRIMEQNLRREHPEASRASIGQRMTDWATARPWKEESPGHLVHSPDRLKKLLRDPP